MKPKTIITATLLLFIAASVVYLLVKETGGKLARSTLPQGTILPASAEGTQGPILPPDKVEIKNIVVYYFHGNRRCTTCRTIEAYTKEAVQTGFSDALKDGRLEMRVVNIEEPANDHFVQDFQLSTRSVVLERIMDGKREDWKNLERVWELVRGDKNEFLKYVQEEIRVYLEELDK